MYEIAWWVLVLIAALSALTGAAVAQLAAARADDGAGGHPRRWYEERTAAYVALMAAFERVVYKLRAGYAAGVTHPDPIEYLDDVGPALMRVRLLASGPVRSAALAVHLVLEQLHARKPDALPGGAEPRAPFLELLGHVPLLQHEFEVAVRDELGIDTLPRPAPEPAPPRRVRALRRAVVRRTAPGAASPDRDPAVRHPADRDPADA